MRGLDKFKHLLMEEFSITDHRDSLAVDGAIDGPCPRKDSLANVSNPLSTLPA